MSALGVAVENRGRRWTRRTAWTLLGVITGPPTVLIALHVIGIWSAAASGRLAAFALLAALALTAVRRRPGLIMALILGWLVLSDWTLLQPGGRHPTLNTAVILAALVVALAARRRFGRLTAPARDRRWWLVIGATVLVLEIVGSTNLGMTMKTAPYESSMSSDASRLTGAPSGSSDQSVPCPNGAPGPFDIAPRCFVSEEGSDVIMNYRVSVPPFVMHPNGPPMTGGLLYAPHGPPSPTMWSRFDRPVCLNHIAGDWYEYVTRYSTAESSTSTCPAGLIEQPEP